MREAADSCDRSVSEQTYSVSSSEICSCSPDQVSHSVPLGCQLNILLFFLGLLTMFV